MEVALVAYAAIRAPSIRRNGTLSMTCRSLNTPGSPSSALITICLSLEAVDIAERHLIETGKYAPPLPRRPDSSTISTVCSGGCERTLARAEKPLFAIYP